MGHCKDGEHRTGDKTNAISRENWNVDTDNNQQKLTKERHGIQIHNSVTEKRLLNTPVNKESCSPMHFYGPLRKSMEHSCYENSFLGAV